MLEEVIVNCICKTGLKLADNVCLANKLVLGAWQQWQLQDIARWQLQIESAWFGIEQQARKASGASNGGHAAIFKVACQLVDNPAKISPGGKSQF